MRAKIIRQNSGLLLRSQLFLYPCVAKTLATFLSQNLVREK